MTTLPDEQVEDVHKLQADAVVELYHILLPTGANLYLKANDSVTWQNKHWEGVSIQIGSVSNSADASEASRPQLVVGNPAGVFSSFVATGVLNRAQVIRYKVLRQHLLADRNVFSRQTWKIMKINSVTKQSIVMELRNQLDGPNFVTPARMYMPPEFPTVTL